MSYTSKIDDSRQPPVAVGKLEQKSLDRYQSNRLLIRVFNSIQMGLAESYLQGWEIPDRVLKKVFDTAISFLYRNFSSLLIPYEWVLTESDALAEASEELMQSQYNLPAAMFGSMLGEDDLLYPKYTMALWEQGAINLREAQLAMLEDTISKAQIKDGDRVLDIGCGWGSAANYILHKFPNVKVTGLNLSHEQCNYIRGKMQDANSYLSSERFSLIEGDFNEIDFDSKFDKIISLGVFEHIGNLTRSFAKLNSFLQPDGRVFIHIIATKLPHNIFNPFLNKYIFPRARAWHYEMIPSCDRDLKTVKQWFLNGSNYSQTLQAWLSNFDCSQDRIRDLDYGMNYSKFRRMWRLYLLWLISHFGAANGEILGNGQYLMVRA